MEKQFTLKDYQIGEFAKRMGVSSHFLKYYEETGILQPETHENGYRFYNMWDAGTVLECKRMKNIGFSVKESRKILTDSTASELDHLLQEHQSRLYEEILQKQLTSTAIQNLRADLRFCLKKEWQICSSKPVWFLPHTVGQQFSGDKGVYQQLTHWVDAMPTVRSTQRLTFLEGGQWQAEWGFSVPAEELAAIGLRTSPPAALMSTEKTFIQYTNYPVSREHAKEQHFHQYNQLVAHIRRMNLVPGRIMLKEIVAYTLKDGIRQVYCILRIPVTEN